MSFNITRIDEATYSVEFNPQKKMPPVVIHIGGRAGGDSKLEQNNEFYYHLARQVAHELVMAKENKRSLHQAISIGDKDWEMHLKKKTDPLLARIFPIFHRQADDKIMRLEVVRSEYSDYANDIMTDENFVVYGHKVVPDDVYNEQVAEPYNIEKSLKLNQEDCQTYAGMLPCTREEINQGMRGKFHYQTPSDVEALQTSMLASPFTVLATLAFQRYEGEFIGHDNFKTSDCKYCLLLDKDILILTSRTDDIEERKAQNRHTVREYQKRMCQEYGQAKLEYACKLAKIDLEATISKGEPLTPEHVYRLNILVHNVETEDLQRLLQKLKACELPAGASLSTTQLMHALLHDGEQPLTIQELRGILTCVLENANKLNVSILRAWIQTYRQQESVEAMAPSQIDTLAKLFFPSEAESHLVFTGRHIYYPIKSGYTKAEKYEFKPWVDQQELLQAFALLKQTTDWDLYHEKLSHIICKKHLFRQHPEKLYATGALIPAPLNAEGQPRWYKVAQANYNGYGMLNYTLLPVGNDPSLPMIKLYRSTTLDPVARFAQKTVRSDFNPLDLPGYEGLGKTDIYEFGDILNNSMPLWVGYVMAAQKLIQEDPDPRKLLKVLSKANIELHKFDKDKYKTLSFPDIIKQHAGILNTLFLKGKIDYFTYNHLREAYLLTSSFREDQAAFKEQVKADAEQLITHLADIKLDLSSFSTGQQQQIATEIYSLIEDLNEHLLLDAADKKRQIKQSKLRKEILHEALQRENLAYEALKLPDAPQALKHIELWLKALSDHAQHSGHWPKPSGHDMHFVGHSLGGSYAQIYALHYLIHKNRIPLPGCGCVIAAFDAPGVNRQDNELFKKFLIDHEDLMKASGVKFTVKHQHEAGDVVHSIGYHLGSAKSLAEAKKMEEVLDFQASVLERNPAATHPSLAEATNVHETLFLEGIEGVDYQRQRVSAYQMALMESYETISKKNGDAADLEGRRLRMEIWKFPVNLSTSSLESLRSSSVSYWVIGQVLSHAVENEPEMIPFLDPLGNFSANEHGLNYAGKELPTSTVLPAERPSWLQKISEKKLRQMLYPGSEMKGVLKLILRGEDLTQLSDLTDKFLSTLNLSRGHMEAIGGERLTLRTSAGNLDGMLLRPDGLYQRLAEAGVVEQSIRIKNYQTKVWRFDRAQPKQMEVKKALENMRFFILGLASTLVDDYYYVGDARVIAEIQKASIFDVPLDFGRPHTPKIEKSPHGVLICGGNMSVYEMFHSEAASFLLRGMNVMLFNPPGFGASQGEPNQESITEGIFAAYDTFVRKAHLKEENVLIKSLCMSGGWASTLAAKHPKTALWLDQTYSSFYPLVQACVQSKIKSIVPEALEKTVMDLIPTACLPAYNVSENLSRHEGWKCLMYSDHDEVIPVEHVLRNIAAIEDTKPVKLIEMPGKHSQTWYRVKHPKESEAYTQLVKEQVDSFLTRADFLHPLFELIQIESPPPTFYRSEMTVEEVEDSEEEEEHQIRAVEVEEAASDDEIDIPGGGLPKIEEVDSDEE